MYDMPGINVLTHINVMGVEYPFRLNVVVFVSFGFVKRQFVDLIKNRMLVRSANTKGTSCWQLYKHTVIVFSMDPGRSFQSVLLNLDYQFILKGN